MLIVLLLTISYNASAATIRSKALKAYRNFLAKNESHYSVQQGNWYGRNTENYKKCWWFLLADMNNDNIPELITFHPYGYKQGGIYIYAYKNGKVKRLPLVKNDAKTTIPGSKYEIFASTYTSASSWQGLTGYCCNKKHFHLHLMTGAGYIDQTYKVVNGKVRVIAEYELAMGKDRCWLNRKKVSILKYNSFMKKCKEIAAFVDNNSNNRKVYVK